jgi:hypothetical protein
LSERGPSLLTKLRYGIGLSAPRPPHAFVLTRNRLVYVGKDPTARKGRVSGEPFPVRVASRPLGPDAFRLGPGGVPVLTESFAKAVSTLVRDLGLRVKSAAVAIPDDFVRVVVVDLEDPERGWREAEEVLQWKFAKFFGEPAPQLRLAWRTAGPGTDGTRVVAMATLEETAVSIEDAFGAAGIRVGALESAALAVSSLAGRSVEGEGFVVWADGDAATTVFLEKGSLRFLRTKATSDPEEALQEIRLAATFVGGGTEGSDVKPADLQRACAAGPSGSPIIARFRAFRSELGGGDPLPISRAALAPEVLLVSEQSGAPSTLSGVEDPAVLVALGAMAGEGG